MRLAKGKNQNMKSPILETRRQVMSTIVCAYPGGRECAAGRLGIALKKLDNHVYESAGSRPLDDTQLHLLEQEAGTTHLPDYISAMYDGVFIRNAKAEQLDNLDLYAHGMTTTIKRGAVDSLIAKALQDGVIDEAELAEIIHAHRQHIAARHSEVDAVITLHRRPQK